jgi:hypothetical protein
VAKRGAPVQDGAHRRSQTPTKVSRGYAEEGPVGGWGDRLKAWASASRTGYVVTNVGIRAVVVFVFASAFGEAPVGRSFGITALFILVAVPIYGWIWYPRAQRKLAARHATRS